VSTSRSSKVLQHYVSHECALFMCHVCSRLVKYIHYSIDSWRANLDKRVGQIVLEIVVSKTWGGVPKVCILNRRPRLWCQALPRNKRLLSALLSFVNQLMIDWPEADVPDPRSRPRQVWRRCLLVLAVGRDCNPTDSCSVREGRHPNNNILPVMAMAKTTRGRILGHIPGIHDGIVSIVSGCACVDLPKVVLAALILTATGCKATTGRISMRQLPHVSSKIRSAPSITRGIHGRKGNTAIMHLKVRLVFQV